jgi:hypothetical protein
MRRLVGKGSDSARLAGPSDANEPLADLVVKGTSFLEQNAAILAHA